MGRRLLLLGPPGAGKGTQAEILCRAMGIPHISTGAMLRDHVERDSDLGRKAREIMEAGDLISDEVVIAMVDERLSHRDAACGFLLDGFPRTLPQASALDALLPKPLEKVVNLDVPEEEAVTRILGRGRSDDTEQAVRTRLAVYRGQTAPLIDHYAGLVHTVDGVGSIPEILGRIVQVLAE